MARNARLHLLAVILDQPIEGRAKFGRKVAIAQHQVRLQIQRQAERVEVARSDRRPLAVGDRHFRVQRTLAVLVDPHSCAQQVIVEHSCSDTRDRHVGLTLQDQIDANTSLRGAPNVAQQAIAGKEVRVGDTDARTRGAKGDPVLMLDVVAVRGVVSRDQGRDDAFA